LLKLYEGDFPDEHPHLSRELAGLHQVLIEIWQDTGSLSLEGGAFTDFIGAGLADMLLDNMEWIRGFPKKMQSTLFLDADDFGAILKHRLTVM
jgi:hypothetical protein